jgi:hypothetical protein
VTLPPSARRRRAAFSVAVALVATLVTVSPVSPVSPAGRAEAATGHHHRHAHHHRQHARKVSRAFFGIHDASTQAYGRIPFGSLRLWDAGVTWRDIETSAGTYDWTRLDALVAHAQRHHVRVTLTLGMTPSFYADAPNESPTDLHAYARYVRAVMHRYRHFNGHRGIASYQVWNEGNIHYFWAGTPHRLAELTRIVYRARNQVDPHAKVVAPSFAIRMGYQQRWFSAYLHTKVAGRHVWHFYDIDALSIYPKASYGGRPGGPEDAMRLVGVAQRRLARAGVPRRTPLWATEINYGVIGGDVGLSSATPISARRQAANVMRTYLLAAAHGLDRVFWYRYDWGRLPDSRGGGTLGNTLLSVPGDYAQVTPAGRALGIVGRWLRGRLVATGRHHRMCARDHHGTYRCTVRLRHSTRTILWNPHREVRVRMARLGSGGRTSSRPAVMHVGYRPVMVRTRR